MTFRPVAFFFLMGNLTFILKKKKKVYVQI